MQEKACFRNEGGRALEDMWPTIEKRKRPFGKGAKPRKRDTFREGYLGHYLEGGEGEASEETSQKKEEKV